MKTTAMLLTLAVLSLPGAMLAQDPETPPPAPAPTAAPDAPATPAPAPAPEAPAPAPAPAAEAPVAPPPAPVTAPPAAPPAPQAVTPPKVIYEKVNVVVDGKAEYAGTIELTLEPDGRAARLVSVNVLAKEKDKKIAEQLHREITIALGAEYKVKLSGNEIRISKANKKFPALAVIIKTLQLPGVSVRVERG
ncbi:MAG: hypothetical protein KJ062_12780, partial [Thermoanaerobaculia bacterium]|nr:hypothetical protein [Thermoanaerobaculia bacterium]